VGNSLFFTIGKLFGEKYHLSTENPETGLDEQSVIHKKVDPFKCGVLIAECGI
jgi:hypothetical protein